MSTSCGACGAYGILLSGVDLPAVAEIRAKLEEIRNGYAEDPGDYNSPEDYPETKELIEPLKKAFRATGINVPEDAGLLWTGSEDDRPAQCETPAEEWVLGFGLFTRPDMFPVMDKSFIEKSEWRTWVWMG